MALQIEFVFSNRPSRNDALSYHLKIMRKYIWSNSYNRNNFRNILSTTTFRFRECCIVLFPNIYTNFLGSYKEREGEREGSVREIYGTRDIWNIVRNTMFIRLHSIYGRQGKENLRRARLLHKLTVSAGESVPFLASNLPSIRFNVGTRDRADSCTRSRKSLGTAWQSNPIQVARLVPPVWLFISRRFERTKHYAR